MLGITANTDRPTEAPVTDGFSFVVSGRLCPNNLVTRRYGRRSVKLQRAREDQERVRNIVRRRASAAGWQLIEDGSAVSLHIVCWNCLGDIDGRQKIIMDAMGQIRVKGIVVEEGIVYDDDKRVKRMLVEDQYDWNGPRYEVTIEKMALPVRGAKPRLLRFEDLGTADLKAVATDLDRLINPFPGVVRPALVAHVPSTWKNRAIRELEKLAA